MLNTITHEIDLNMSQPCNFRYVHIMQYDYDAEYIKCNLYDGNKPYIISCTKDSIIVKCELPDGKEIESKVESIDNNSVAFKITDKMTQTKGDIFTALSLVDANGKKSPFPFIIKVIKAPEGIPDDDIHYGKQGEYYANLSKSYAIGTGNEVRENDDIDNSKYYCNKAAQSANNGNISAINAKNSENIAATNARNANVSAENAASYALKAEQSKNIAKEAENKASSAITTITSNSANSKKYADLAQSYAVGTGNSIRENDMSDNSKYYWELVKDAIDNGQLAELEYFETYDEFEEALRNDNIRDDILVVIKDHIYSSDDNNDIIDNALSLESRHAVQNKIVTKALNDLDAKIPQVDARLSSISENPVQNKIIYSKLEEISNKINDLNTKLEEVSNKITNSGSNTGSSDVTGNTIESDYAVLAGWRFASNGNLTNGQSHIIGTNAEHTISSNSKLTIFTNNKSNISIMSSKNFDIMAENIGIHTQGDSNNIYIGGITDGSYSRNNNIYLIGKVYVNGKLLE